MAFEIDRLLQGDIRIAHQQLWKQDTESHTLPYFSSRNAPGELSDRKSDTLLGTSRRRASDRTCGTLLREN